MAILLTLLTLAGAYFSFHSPSEKELLDRFAEAQRFYAEGAYDQAIPHYAAVSQVHSRMLDTRSLQVVVGEASYPVQEAAIYQIGNANRKLFTDDSRFAQQGRDQATHQRWASLADSALRGAETAFRRVIDTATNRELRGQAYGRLVELYYEAGQYDRVIEVSGQLIEAFGTDPMAKVGYYNTGWAYYQTERYEKAIAAFQGLLARYPTGFEADRSLFQIGECYFALERYEEAIASYRELVQRQHLDQLTEADLERIRREKRAGLVDETALELAAKAQIRIGTSYARLGRYDEGIKAYRSVIEQFSTERRLVEEAYLQLAQLYDDGGDAERAQATYREAIRETADRSLRARIQYALAERLLAHQEYGPSISEFRIYLQAYGDMASQVGFPAARVRYRLGSAHQRWAQQLEQAGDGRSRAQLERAVAQYDTLLAQDPEGPYAADARFNRAVALQSLGTPQSLAAAQATYEELASGAAGVSYVARSLLQLAQLHKQNERYSASVAAAQRLLTEFPDSDQADEARLLMGLSYQQMGQLQEAVQAFAGIGPDSPLFGRAAMGGGHALLTLGRPQAALTTLEAGLERADSASVASYQYLIGQSHQALGDPGQALEHFDAGLAADPPRDLAQALRLARGNTALLTGDLDLAIDDLRWVIDKVRDPAKVKYARDALSIAYLRQNRGGDALAVLDEMTRTAQGSQEQADLLSRILDLYYDRDDFEQTAVVAQRLLDLDFADAPSQERPFRLKEKALYLLGDARLRLGQEAAAMTAFSRFLERYPASMFAVPVRLNRAIHLFAAGDLDAAVDALEDLRQRQLEPEQAFAVDFYLANSRYSLRQFEPARALFADLVAANPNAPERPDLLFGLAESLYQLGRFEEASTYYRRILDEFPHDPSADDAQYNLAWCLIELGRQDEAKVQFERVLTNYPDSEFAASAQFTLGDYDYNRQRYAEALEAYRKVQSNYPDAPVATQVPRLLAELQEALAYQEYAKGLELMDAAEAGGGAADYRRAIAVFERVRRDYPGTESEIGAISNMAVCLESLGRWREAVTLYEEVIARYEKEQTTKDAYQFAKAHRDWIVSTRL